MILDFLENMMKNVLNIYKTYIITTALFVVECSLLLSHNMSSLPKMRLRIGNRWIYGKPTTFEMMKEVFQGVVAQAETVVDHLVCQGFETCDMVTERFAALRPPTPEPESIGSGWELVKVSEVPPTADAEDWIFV